MLVGTNEAIDLVRVSRSRQDQSPDDVRTGHPNTIVVQQLNKGVESLGDHVRHHERPVSRRSPPHGVVPRKKFLVPGHVLSIRVIELGLNWVTRYTDTMTLASDINDIAADAMRTRFASADWTFASRTRSEGEFHPYPARYIPELPAQVLDLLDIRSGTVLDPFCGSGTTLAVARKRGLQSIGVDINPIACLISRVRSSRWSDGDADHLKSHLSGLRAAAAGSTMVGSEFSEIPRLDHWFPDYAQIALSGAVRYVRGIPEGDPWRDRVAVAVSAATVRVSRQDSDTRYAAIDKAGDQRTVADALVRSLTKTGAWLERNASTYDPLATSLVLNQDARDLSPIDDESVAAACFSPPYPNAYEYWLYHKYRMYWLGFDAVSVRESEIGARPHYSKKNGLTEHDFADQMTEVLREVHRVLRDGSRAVIVIGDSVIGGRTINNGELIADVGRTTGFTTEFAGVRDIATGKSSFNRAHSRGRRTEHIIVLRNHA